MEKTEFASIAINSMDKCAVIFRKDPLTFLYVCYHCCASFSDIDCTLQHIESHFQSVQDGIEDNHIKSECMNPKNAANVDQETDNIRDVTDTADPEIFIKTEVMESEEYRGGGSLDANNICDLTGMTDTEFDIKMEVMEDDEENSGSCTPSDLIESSRFAGQETIPATSKERYDKMYKEFKKWQALKKTTSISHTVLLAFFHELAQKHKPSTLWVNYSMLKATIKVNDNIDIGSYTPLRAFLKTKATGYKPVKARVFSEAEIHRFIDNAPDELWLDVKVVCIFGVTGACRTFELPRITLKDIENHGDLLLVRILKSNLSVDRSFTITGKFRTVVQKYAALRTPNIKGDRFFINYQHGKCTGQVIGKHKFALMPRRIAEYLQLSEPEGCKGFSFGHINCTLQHFESHSQSVQDAIEYNHIKSECMNPKNASNVDQETDNIRDVTDTADPEIFIETKVMESEEYLGGDSLDADNISDLTELTPTDFDIKMEVMEDDEENSGRCTPSDLIESARFASQEILPASSRERYDKMYKDFKKWQTLKKTTRISPTVLLAFFHELAQKNKPSTLWSNYSMLKATIKVNDNIDIGSYTQLSAFLRKRATGYKPVKARVFDEADIQKFIDNAPDELWLDVKVVCIFGVTGACRTFEFPRIRLKDIENHGDLLLVRIPKSNRSAVDRSFTITGKFRTVVQKYAALRTPNMIGDRFFINYQRGKCTRQVIGTHKFAQMPRRIAKYLQLPEPEGFSGHSFRKTSTNILAKTLVDTETPEQCGSWRSIAVLDESRQIEENRTDRPVTRTINATSSKSVSFQVAENVAKVINTFKIENDDENHETIHGIFGK